MIKRVQKRSFSEEPLLDAEFWPLDDDRERICYLGMIRRRTP